MNGGLSHRAGILAAGGNCSSIHLSCHSDQTPSLLSSTPPPPCVARLFVTRAGTGGSPRVEQRSVAAACLSVKVNTRLETELARRPREGTILSAAGRLGCQVVVATAAGMCNKLTGHSSSGSQSHGWSPPRSGAAAGVAGSGRPGLLLPFRAGCGMICFVGAAAVPGFGPAQD